MRHGWKSFSLSLLRVEHVGSAGIINKQPNCRHTQLQNCRPLLPLFPLPHLPFPPPTAAGSHESTANTYWSSFCRPSSLGTAPEAKVAAYSISTSYTKDSA